MNRKTLSRRQKAAPRVVNGKVMLVPGKEADPGPGLGWAEGIFRGSAPLRERDRGSVWSRQGWGYDLPHGGLKVINLVLLIDL